MVKRWQKSIYRLSIKKEWLKKLLNSLKAYLKGVINLKFEIGDVIELDFGKEYIIVNECIIETKEYYLVLDKNDTENTIIKARAT